MTVGSLFAGIGGFDLGFERSGFDVCWQAESDVKARAVLALRFPESRCYDDVRTIGASNLEPVDVITGGFPCQDVSVAGKREGLGGERTGLFWEVVRIAREMQPRWMVLENVPGLLSSHGGRDFHTVLSALADGGFRRAYRILDSRYFGVAQRRRRVFVVLRARRGGDSPAQVLFESESGGGDSQTGDEARPDVAATLRGRSHGAGVNAPGRGGEDDQNLVSVTPQGYSGRNHVEDQYIPTVAACLNPGHEAKHSYAGDGGTLNIVCAPTLNQRMRGPTDNMMDVLSAMSQVPTLQASLGHHGHSSPRGDGSDPIIAVRTSGHGGSNGLGVYEHGDAATLDTTGDMGIAFALRADPGGTGQGHNTTYPGGVRRLTPLECERLQGFPDGWTCLCGDGHRGSAFCKCSDSPRYRQLGNAVTVTVAEWIARRIQIVDAVLGCD